MVRHFAVEFLGCKVNQYEVEAFREGFERLGLTEAPAPEEADLYLLNTCSVTGHAGATSRKHLRRALRARPGARVLVTGCYAESDRARLEAIPGVERVFGNAEKEGILDYVSREVLERGDAPVPPLGITRFAGQTRAFVKIEDGCEDGCSFCIIPALRGAARSREAAEIVSEVRELVASGHREIVLTGVHLGYFGRGRGPRGAALLDLLRQLREVPGLGRLKLSSIEVQELSDDLIALLASDPIFAPHLHVPLQSGSDRTLQRMRRKYSAGTFSERVEALRSAFDRPAISTDLIVGFPGEEAADFAESLAFCREIAFMRIHVFPYSLREGTVAAELPGHRSPGLIAERRDAALELGEELARQYRRSFLGARATVLVEGRRDPGSGMLRGLSERYLQVEFAGPDRLQGHLVDVWLEDECGPAGLRGRLLAREEVV